MQWDPDFFNNIINPRKQKWNKSVHSSISLEEESENQKPTIKELKNRIMITVSVNPCHVACVLCTSPYIAEN